jgi:hypothetical protein
MESKTHITILGEEECLKTQPVCPSVNYQKAKTFSAEETSLITVTYLLCVTDM